MAREQEMDMLDSIIRLNQRVENPTDLMTDLSAPDNASVASSTDSFLGPPLLHDNTSSASSASDESSISDDDSSATTSNSTSTDGSDLLGPPPPGSLTYGINRF